MKKGYLLVLLILVTCTSCQSIINLVDIHDHIFETAIFSKDEHSTKIIKVEVDEYLQANLMNIQFERIIEYEKSEGKDCLYVSGPIRKPLNKSLSTAYVQATFLDEQGEIIYQESTKVIPSRTHLNRGLKGRFTIKTLYSPKIVKCKLEIKWGKDDAWIEQ